MGFEQSYRSFLSNVEKAAYAVIFIILLHSVDYALVK